MSTVEEVAMSLARRLRDGADRIEAAVTHARETAGPAPEIAPATLAASDRLFAIFEDRIRVLERELGIRPG